MGRSVLITGGNRGIGLATARVLMLAGNRVAVTYRTSRPGLWIDDLRHSHLYPVKCDVRDATSVDEAFAAVEEHQGPVEVLVVNAGIDHVKRLDRLSDDVTADVLNTNLAGAFRVTRRALPEMTRHRWGRLIYVGDAMATTGLPAHAAYVASKTALVGLVRSLVQEIGPNNITANIVAPGLTRTDRTAQWPATQWASVCNRTPMGRSADPEKDIAPLIPFLASEGAGYITGEVIRADGSLGMGQ